VTPSDEDSSNLSASASFRAALWPVVLMVAIFFASSQSEVAAPAVTGIDKIGHFVVYAWLGVLWVRCPWIARLKPLGVWSAVAIASLYGLTDEIHQSFTPGRSVEVADWVVDTLGAFVAVAIYTRWHGLRRWLEASLFARNA
jgi:Predicted integral membrane protein